MSEEATGFGGGGTYDSADGSGKADRDGSQADLDWVGIPDTRDGEGPKVQEREEIGAGDESHSERQPDHALAFEELERNHRISSEL